MDQFRGHADFFASFSDNRVAMHAFLPSRAPAHDRASTMQLSFLLSTTAPQLYRLYKVLESHRVLE